DGEVEKLVAEIEAMKPGGRPPFLAAQAARFKGRLLAARGDLESAEQGFRRAEQIFREYGISFWLAITELEHGEALAEQGRVGEEAPVLAGRPNALDELGQARSCAVATRG